MTTLSPNGLQQTTDYAQFKLRADNRPICKGHVMKLKDQIAYSNDLHLHPLIVNEEMEVIDGQHRLIAAKELGVPVYYIMDTDFDPQKMIAFNITQKRWNPDDYMNYWKEQGREDYKQFEYFMEDVGFSLRPMFIWLGDTAGVNKEYKNFRMGTFKFHMSEELLLAIHNGKRLIDWMKDRGFKPLKTYRQGAFHVALKAFFINPLVDPEHFFERLEKSPYAVKYANEWQDYFQQLVDIYNYQMKRNKLKVIQDQGKRELSL